MWARKPSGAASDSSSSASPRAPRPKRWLNPTTISRARSVPTRTSWTNAFASIAATAGVNGITTVVSIPVSAISSSRSSSVVIGSGARSGWRTSIGWRSNVHASARSLPSLASVTAVPRMARWPRWMPSKAPSATALGPASGGKDSSPRTICMQDANGPDLAPARRQFTDADQRAAHVVDAHESFLGRGGWDHVGRLPMAERRRARPIETHRRPARQHGLHRQHVLPESCRLGTPLRRFRAPLRRFRAPLRRFRAAPGQLAPRHRVAQFERPDPRADEILDRAAAAEGSPEIRGEHAYVGPLPAHDAEGCPWPVDLLDHDRADEDLARGALDLDALARELV